MRFEVGNGIHFFLKKKEFFFSKNGHILGLRYQHFFRTFDFTFKKTRFKIAISNVFLESRNIEKRLFLADF